MNDEERKDKYLPEIIDVEVEPDLDFELREPQDSVKEESQDTVPVETINDIIETEKYIYDTAHDEETYQKSNQKVDATEKSTDTSFTTFKNNQKVKEKKWRRKTGNILTRIILLFLGVFIGLPLFGGVGFVGVVALGMAVFFCGIAFGLGLLGIGVGAFLLGAETASVGAVVFFGSLMGIGGGGLGLLIIVALIIWIKNLIVKFFASINRPKHEEEER